MKRIRATFTSGIIIVAPLAITFWIIQFVFGFLDDLLRPLIDSIFGFDIPGTGIVALILIIFAAGAAWQLGLGKFIIEKTQSALLKIPIVGAVYKPARQLLDSFTGSSSSGFEKVVIIEYPKQGTWMIAFLTSITTTQDGEMAVVYVPTAPTPNSGWVGVIPIDQVYEVDMTISQAMSMVLSGGIDSPDNITMTNMSTASENMPSLAASQSAETS